MSTDIEDQFTPAVRYLVVATKSASRYFDLDAVRGEPSEWELKYAVDGYGHHGTHRPNVSRADGGVSAGAKGYQPQGSPPLDWWKVSDDYEPEGDTMGMATWYTGDALTVLRTLPDASVDLGLMSPPFLALRSYLPADHPDKGLEVGSEGTPGAFLDVLLDVTEELARVLAPHGSLVVELGDTYAGGGGGPDPGKYGAKDDAIFEMNRQTKHMRADPGGWPLAKSLCMIPSSYAWALAYGRNPWTGRTTPPWRVRNLIAWCRPNPPVGALGDKFRPGTSYLTVACKNANRYFDLDAVREPGASYDRDTTGDNGNRKGADREDVRTLAARTETGSAPLVTNPAGAPPLDWWAVPDEARDDFDSLAAENVALYAALEAAGVFIEPDRFHPATRYLITAAKSASRYFDLDAVREPATSESARRQLEQSQKAGDKGRDQRINPRHGDDFHPERLTGSNPAGAPPLDWWEIPTHPYPGAHYATFPPQLCVRPIKAMCPQRVCRVCGKPRERITESDYGALSGRMMPVQDGTRGLNQRNPAVSEADRVYRGETLGWSDCGHNDYRNGIVLDCFAGSGTTLEVATGHGRDAIGIDLDPRNVALAEARIGMFLQVKDVPDARTQSNRPDDPLLAQGGEGTA